MPPTTNMQNASSDTGHMLAEYNRTPKKTGIGPWIGTAIILILLGFGALYFWGAYLNRTNSVDQLPFIPGDTTS